MFTGIIECLGKIVAINRDQENIHIRVESVLADHLKIDQSLAHDGVCLTVVAIEGSVHTVTAIQETLEKTALRDWKVGKVVNLERAMKLGDRLDGHLVQGHVDQVGKCLSVDDESGSWRYTFRFNPDLGNIVIEKGSITINGTSLTVIDAQKDRFSVAIIPYTHEHTNFHQIEVGNLVNLEFDMIGKYIARLHERS
ncbi:MAG: riboflavin synthase [Flavobacteriaceae bacterium]|nr:riboflavin synthase [Flavobacteriaceae bacterium]